MALAADPPNAEMAAASAAIDAASQAQARGDAGLALEQAQASYDLANQAMAKRRFKDALRHAELAHANADLALAKARLAQARSEVDAKSARNADLRRQLLVRPGAGR